MNMNSKRKSKKKRGNPDFILVAVVFLLIVIGSIMVFSSSPATGKAQNGKNAYSFIKNQLMYVGAGTVALIVAASIPMSFFKKTAPYLFLASIAATCLTFVPGIGVSVNEARRWIKIAGVSAQPSELLKIGVILYIAFVFSKSEAIAENARGLWGLLLVILPLGIAIIPVILQPHNSCIVIILFVSVVMMIFAGIRWYMIPIIAGGGGILGTIMYFFVPRFKTRMFPWISKFIPNGKKTVNQGFAGQGEQALYALASGGFFGKGLGNSIQKELYLSESYNDFIFAIVGEEFGFFGCVFVAALYVLLTFTGFRIAASSKDTFSAYTAIGITSLIAIQAFMNMLVVTGIGPLTGVSLPLFGYGGTSLVTMMINVGLLINISKDNNV